MSVNLLKELISFPNEMKADTLLNFFLRLKNIDTAWIDDYVVYLVFNNVRLNSMAIFNW